MSALFLQLLVVRICRDIPQALILGFLIIF